MSANVETMFYVREKPWHNLGVRVEEALSSKKALELGGLDWNVIQKEVYTNYNMLIPSFKANIRESDNKVLGVVTDRYKIVQNKEAFAFTDSLIGEGCKYETAGSLQEGKRVWMLAKLPEKYQILDDEANFLNRKKIDDKKVLEFINELIPLTDTASKAQEKNIELLRNNMKLSYFEAPDLVYLPKIQGGTHMTNLKNKLAQKIELIQPSSTVNESNSNDFIEFLTLYNSI